jgi:hypothetical protein
MTDDDKKFVEDMERTLTGISHLSERQPTKCSPTLKR